MLGDAADRDDPGRGVGGKRDRWGLPDRWVLGATVEMPVLIVVGRRGVSRRPGANEIDLS